MTQKFLNCIVCLEFSEVRMLISRARWVDGERARYSVSTINELTQNKDLHVSQKPLLLSSSELLQPLLLSLMNEQFIRKPEINYHILITYGNRLDVFCCKLCLLQRKDIKYCHMSAVYLKIQLRMLETR